MHPSIFLEVQAVYQRKIHTAASRAYKQLPGFATEDVEQELLEVLWHCVAEYDPNNGAKFNTYFWQCARNKISDLTRRATTIMRQSENFVTLIASEDLDEDTFTTICDKYRQEISAEDWADLREGVRIAVNWLNDEAWGKLVGDEQTWQVG